MTNPDTPDLRKGRNERNPFPAMPTTLKLPTKSDILNHLGYSNATQDKLLFYIGNCNFDLYFGPHDDGDEDGVEYKWVDFVDGIKKIKEIVSDDINKTLYFDNDCGQILDKLPEGEYDESTGEFIEPYLESIYELDVKEVLFGKELSGYI